MYRPPTQAAASRAASQDARSHRSPHLLHALLAAPLIGDSRTGSTRGSRCASTPAATTAYSGNNRFTVRPSARDRQPNGQRDHGKHRESPRVATHHEHQPRDHEQRSDRNAASTAALGRVVAITAPTSVKVRVAGTSERSCLRSAQPHAVFPGRGERAMLSRAASVVYPSALSQASRNSRAPSPHGRSSAATAFCSAATGRSRTSVAATASPEELSIVTVTSSAFGELESDVLFSRFRRSRPARSRGQLRFLHERGVCLSRWVISRAAKQPTTSSANTHQRSPRRPPARAADGPPAGAAQAPPSRAKRSTVSERSPKPQRLQREHVLGHDVAEVALAVEAVQQPHLLLAARRLEDQLVGVDRVHDLIDQARCAPRRRLDRFPRSPTRAPRRSPSMHRPRGRVRSAPPTHREP